MEVEVPQICVLLLRDSTSRFLRPTQRLQRPANSCRSDRTLKFVLQEHYQLIAVYIRSFKEALAYGIPHHGFNGSSPSATMVGCMSAAEAT